MQSKHRTLSYRLMFIGQRVLALVCICCCLQLLTACSSASHELPSKEVFVHDPIQFEVEGVEGEVESNIMAFLESMPVISKKRAFLYIREIQETTRRAVKAFGFYHPNIDVILPEKDNPKDMTIVVKVDAGKPLYIRECTVEILGEGSAYKVFHDIVKESGISAYQILHHDKYEELKRTIQETALSLGFFDGKFVSKRILVYQEQNFADLDLIFDSGKRYHFGELVLANDESEKLLRPSKNLQNFKEGDPFQNKTINSYIQSLVQTNYYRSVDVHPRLDMTHDYEVPIEIGLERKAHNNVRLGAGYSTDEGPRVLMEWNKPLLNDRGNSFSSLITASTLSQDARLIYKIPYKNPNLDYFTINAVQTHTDFNDTVSDRSHLSFHYIEHNTGAWRRDYSLRLEYEDYTQASEKDNVYNIIPAVRIMRRESSGGFDPELGYSISLEALGGSRAWADLSFLQFNFLYKALFAPTENSRILFRAEQGMTLGDDASHVPPSLRYFTGGDNAIRGFSFKSAAPQQSDNSGLKGGKYLTTGTVELQTPCGISNSRLAFFLDAGMSTDDYTDDILWGPGIGYRYLSPYGAIRVDFAVGMQGGEDNNYRIHIAFGPEF